MWKKVCAGMLSAALLTGAAGTVFAAEANDDVVSLVTQPGQPLVTTTAKTTAAAPVKETAAKAEAPAKVELADRLVINLAARSIAAIRDNQKVALYPIGPGKVSTPTPTGGFATATSFPPLNGRAPRSPTFQDFSKSPTPSNFRK